MVPFLSFLIAIAYISYKGFTCCCIHCQHSRYLKQAYLILIHTQQDRLPQIERPIVLLTNQDNL